MLTRSEIRESLLAAGSEQEELFAAARQLRDETFGQSVVLRGVIEVTNVCRVNCAYCPMRRDNTRYNDRYFMSSDQILERARRIREESIDIILLQGGRPRRISRQSRLPSLGSEGCSKTGSRSFLTLEI